MPSFSESLKASELAVLAVKAVLRRNGWWAASIGHRDRIAPIKHNGEPLPDPGDLMVWHQDESGRKFDVRTVDVKQNFNWGDGPFPFDTIYLTTRDQLHFDWLYIVANNPMNRFAFIDMRSVDPCSVEFHRTVNPRGARQVSTAIPRRYAKFWSPGPQEPEQQKRRSIDFPTPTASQSR